MAKFKLARGKKKSAPSRGAVPCVILLLSAMALVAVLFYAFVRQG